ncbi:MAG: hypothetical protein ABJA79_01725 [Parafilimonas sp.]
MLTRLLQKLQLPKQISLLYVLNPLAEFIARFHLDNKSDKNFDSDFILCLSEVVLQQMMW